MTVGTEVKIIGRVQSRNYEKKYGDGTVEQRVAYEVSVANLELINNEEKSSRRKRNRRVNRTNLIYWKLGSLKNNVKLLSFVIYWLLRQLTL